ncbi:unnamed protein product, partial [marine sediment metagenome]
ARYDKRKMRELYEALRSNKIRIASHIHVPHNYNWVPEMEEGVRGIEE